MARKYETIKQYATQLLLYTVKIDENGRNIGYSYLQILRKIRKYFPVVTYGGPHKGTPPRMTVAHLQRIACGINQDARLPVRPRHKKRRKKRTA